MQPFCWNVAVIGSDCGGKAMLDARRFTVGELMATAEALVIEGIRLALRAQPVNVKSACLKFRTYS